MICECDNCAPPPESWYETGPNNDQEIRVTTTEPATMTVRVRDNAAEAAAWGSGRGGPIIRTVTISTTCPRCGGPRGTARGHNFHADGEWAHVNVWDNPCGHVDMYADVIREAKQADR